MMKEDIVQEVLRRQEQMAAERYQLESHWQEIAELIAPMRAEFTIARRPGEKRQQQIFDSTAGMAADNLAAGLWGMITNSANEWFALRAADDAANEIGEVKQWLEVATQRMRDAFSANGLRFYTRVVDLYSDLVAFGTGVFYSEEVPGRVGLHYSCRHLTECFIAEDDHEQVDTVYRKFNWTARQALHRWGEACSEAVQKAATKEPERKFAFIHAVMPRRDLQRGRLDAKAMPYASYYIELEGRRLLSEGGYPEFPYQVPRWGTRSRGVYGDSPAMMALPDIKMVNAMAKTTIVAAQKAADPPILAPDETSIRGIRTTPGGIIYGGVDEQGRARYQPFQTGANIGLTAEMEDQRRSAIREAFHWSLLLMVAQPNQTATEILARQEEKIRLMGPHLGRLQSEFLDPLIDRQFNAMMRQNLIPPAPREIASFGGIRVSYVSPAAQAQKAAEGNAIVRAFQAVAPLVGLNPQVMDNIDIDSATRSIFSAFGAPARILNDADKVEMQRANRQQAEGMAGALGAAGSMSGVAKNLSQVPGMDMSGVDMSQIAAMIGGPR